jgi:hypothetical protein
MPLAKKIMWPKVATTRFGLAKGIESAIQAALTNTLGVPPETSTD